MTARERIARANRLDAARNGRPTAHCDDCGHLTCECAPVVPAQPIHDDEPMPYADRIAWERELQA